MTDATHHAADAIRSGGRVVVLTGAGISAESGIPTFRGKDGYWTVGSREYHPQEMATSAMFTQHPDQVWPWYLYRRGICSAADPNHGHQTLVALEDALADRFLLITQNVDGLHIRAGNSREHTYEIHGNLHRMRCAQGCSTEQYPVPDNVHTPERNGGLHDADRPLLRCPRCDGWARPHVLWFDECYDEAWYRFESSLNAAVDADVLIVVGTSGATNLPMQVGGIAVQRGAVIIDINPQDNPFSRMADQAPRGAAIQGTAGQALPPLVRTLVEAANA